MSSWNVSSPHLNAHLTSIENPQAKKHYFNLDPSFECHPSPNALCPNFNKAEEIMQTLPNMQLLSHLTVMSEIIIACLSWDSFPLLGLQTDKGGK